MPAKKRAAKKKTKTKSKATTQEESQSQGQEKEKEVAFRFSRNSFEGMGTSHPLEVFSGRCFVLSDHTFDFLFRTRPELPSRDPSANSLPLTENFSPSPLSFRRI